MSGIPKGNMPGIGNELIHMQSSEVVEAGINMLLAVRQCPENKRYRKEIDDEIRYQSEKLKKRVDYK